MIKNEIKTAMNMALKEGKQVDLKVLRFVISQIQYEEINKQKELTDEEVISLLQKEVKKRKEAIELFKKGDRFDLVSDEEEQIKVIEKYLPKQMTEEEIKKIIDETLPTLSDTTNTGKVIGAVMAKLTGRANGSQVSQLVKKKLHEAVITYISSRS